MSNPIAVLRAGILTVLVADTELAAIVGTRIVYRPRREITQFPALTFFDFGVRPDPTVPLLERRYQFDAWGETLTDAEAIRERVRLVFETLAPLEAAVRPAVNLRLFTWEGDREIPEDNAETVHVVAEYRCLAYYNQPEEG